MTDPRPCPACAFANAPGAEHCAACNATLTTTSERSSPGKTRRDPDDPTLAPSPLLRAVLRGEPDAFTEPASPMPATPHAQPPPSDAAGMSTTAPALTRERVEQLNQGVDQAALLRDLAERLHARRPEPIVHYAGFLVRAAAFLVDGAILGACGLPLTAAGYLGLLAGMAALGKPEVIAPDETLTTLLIAAWFAMATAYFTVLHGRGGQTIGKALVGITVRTLELRPIGLSRALLRTLAYAISSSFFGFGFFLVALTPRKRGWHDFLAGTCVVRTVREGGSA
ncbi:MAG: hypothetical protein B6D46_09755 [Polyangiaceae bacterium UTPRO1]|jgi:uncharacterized RDD family membrane protein YckC|nr:RDD family protein [Myxococcales bacterium]OQY66731.1 MAG: hypothetical protein B6D46_09755 [Polyangiaceae bacterium UTPRO1]